MAIGIPICFLLKISLIAPPATLRKTDPKNPERNLPNKTPSMVFDQVVRHCHIILKNNDDTNVIRLPYSSLIGDKIVVQTQDQRYTGLYPMY